MAPLPLPLPDLSSLDLLVSVGQLGSINAAASRHRITQPAASMRIRALERTLGIQLLERTTAGSRLTPGGAATVEWAAAVIEDVRALLAGAAALRNQASPLEIAASMTVAEYLIPRWLEQLSVDLPGTSVSMKMGNTAEVIRMVEDGGVELGFIEGAQLPGRLLFEDLWTDELAIVVAKGHPWASHHGPISSKELAATPLVMREPGSGTREVLVAALAERGLQPSPFMELASTTAIKAAVIGGSGPAVLSALAVSAELRAGQLVEVKCSDLRFARTIRVVWRPSHLLTHGATALVRLARTTAATRTR